MAKAPSALADKFVIRLPDGMRDRLRQRATANRRTMNAEVILYIDRGLAAAENESPAGTAIPPGSDHSPQLATDEGSDD